MSDTRELLRPAVEGFEPMPNAFEKVLDRRDRKLRNRRIGSAVVGLLVAGVAIGALLRAFSSGTVPAAELRDPFLGTWVSTSDADGGTQTMTVEASADGAVEITVTDDVAWVCGGTPSTMTGAGRIEGTTALVIPTPVFTCDEGIEPQALSGPPLADQLRDLTFVLDPQTDTLADGLGGVWLREGTEDLPTTDDTVADLEPMWPQTSLQEVRRAQELADAGDPEYTWQVVPGLEVQLGQNHPSGGETIFARFLEEGLGWEEYLWTEAFAHRDGLDAGDVIYVRCAPGETNPLYPDDPDGGGCAPTIDEVRYETVKIHAAQLDRRGDRGIWVVTGWEMIEPAEQIPPPSDDEITSSLGAFLQARIDGGGAEGLADLSEYDPLTDVRVDRKIPLLYATSAGAPYERSELELVDGPGWPEGPMRFEVRLFTENDETVVEQVFSLERDGTGRLRPVYDIDKGLDGSRPGTTENGKAVPVEYAFLDGEVTYRSAYPAAPISGYIWDQGPDVATVVGAHERRLLLILADPRPIGPDCEEIPASADAEALARRIRSNPDLEAEAPEPVTVGGIPALQIDVVMAPNAAACPWQMPDLSSTTPLLLEHAPFVVQGADRARLYLLDLPGGSAQVLAIAIMSDEDSFERALEVAAPIVDSFEFHAR